MRQARPRIPFLRAFFAVFPIGNLPAARSFPLLAIIAPLRFAACESVLSTTNLLLWREIARSAALPENVPYSKDRVDSGLVRNGLMTVTPSRFCPACRSSVSKYWQEPDFAAATINASQKESR